MQSTKIARRVLMQAYISWSPYTFSQVLTHSMLTAVSRKLEGGTGTLAFAISPAVLVVEWGGGQIRPFRTYDTLRKPRKIFGGNNCMILLSHM
jgi:hypothetical protein